MGRRGWLLGVGRALLCVGELRRCSLGEQSVKVDVVFGVAAEEGEGVAGSHADALRAPVRKNKEDGGGAEARVDAVGAGAAERGGDGEGGERCAKEAVAAASEGDKGDLIGRELGGHGGLDGGEGADGGGSAAAQLQQSGGVEGCGVELVGGEDIQGQGW